ncbi:MAG: radical SAM family heme chaperone HemW [Melioribacteraceae bacterium]|nr:radical SAM family heme chaperone HemW [Melioribacteraceae bacterium]
MQDLSLYIHIPFCDHKCIYCDFYSIIKHENINQYFNSLLTELSFYSENLKKKYVIKSIFFGGGTPSFVNPELLNSVITKIREELNVDDRVEITMETNPGTVDKNKILLVKSTGINRISIGIQSFDETELKFLTRIHDRETAIKTVYDFYESGFENISIDLMFNLPGQTKSVWTSNLKQAVELPVNHISAYSLILEKGTILNKMVLDGKVKMQDEDYDADLYELAIQFLSDNGYRQYEVSNFSKKGFECLHNLAYWRHKEYLGLGTSAHSFINNKRWWNYSSLRMYMNSVASKGYAVRSSELLKPDELREEYVMLNLRGPGLNLKELYVKYGNTWYEHNKKYIDKLFQSGFIIRNDNFIKFTSRGYALCDEILSNFH